MVMRHLISIVVNIPPGLNLKMQVALSIWLEKRIFSTNFAL